MLLEGTAAHKHTIMADPASSHRRHDAEPQDDGVSDTGSRAAASGLCERKSEQAEEQREAEREKKFSELRTDSVYRTSILAWVLGPIPWLVLPHRIAMQFDHVCVAGAPRISSPLPYALSH